MSPVLALALLAVAGVLATKLPRPPRPRSSTLRLLALGGSLLLVTGLTLGPGIAALDAPTLAGLAPVLALAVGWVAADFGAHVEWRLVRRLERLRALALVAPAAVAAAVVVLAAWLATRGRLGWVAIASLGAFAAVSGPDALSLLARVTGRPRRSTRALGRAAVCEALLGTILVALLLAMREPRPGFGATMAAALVGLTLAAGCGAISALMFFGLARPTGMRAPVPFALLAAVLVGAGLGWAAGGSPFVVCAIGGMLIANESRGTGRREVQATLEAWTPAFAAVLLVVAGALALAPTWRLPALVAGLALLRVGAKWAGGRLAFALAPHRSLPPNSGLALVAQGGLVVALAVNVFLMTSGGATEATGARALLTAALLGVVLAQVAAVPFAALALGPRAG